MHGAACLRCGASYRDAMRGLRAFGTRGMTLPCGWRVPEASTEALRATGPERGAWTPVVGAGLGVSWRAWFRSSPTNFPGQPPGTLSRLRLHLSEGHRERDCPVWRWQRVPLPPSGRTHGRCPVSPQTSARTCTIGRPTARLPPAEGPTTPTPGHPRRGKRSQPSCPSLVRTGPQVGSMPDPASTRCCALNAA